MSEWTACLLTRQNQKRHLSYQLGLLVAVPEVTWPTWDRENGRY